MTEEKIIDCEEDDEAAVSGSNDDDEEDRAGRRGGGGGRGRSRARRQGRQHQAAVALSTLEEESEEAVRQKEEADERCVGRKSGCSCVAIASSLACGRMGTRDTTHVCKDRSANESMYPPIYRELDLRIGQKLAEFDRAHWMGALQQARRLSPGTKEALVHVFFPLCVMPVRTYITRMLIVSRLYLPTYHSASGQGAAGAALAAGPHPPLRQGRVHGPYACHIAYYARVAPSSLSCFHLHPCVAPFLSHSSIYPAQPASVKTTITDLLSPVFGRRTLQEPSQTVHQEVHLLLSKACAMLIDDLAARGWVVATESSRKCLQVRGSRLRSTSDWEGVNRLGSMTRLT